MAIEKDSKKPLLKNSEIWIWIFSSPLIFFFVFTFVDVIIPEAIYFHLRNHYKEYALWTVLFVLFWLFIYLKVFRKNKNAVRLTIIILITSISFLIVMFIDNTLSEMF